VPDALALQSACLNTVIVDEFVSLLQGRDKPENLSPFHHLKAGMPPVCLIHGAADDLVPFESVKEYAEKSVAMGNRCELHPFEGTDHFFGNVDGAEVFRLIDDFFVSLGYL
jgi:dipeptidyl aminopeptidase/acylaminoacyl peptidase